MADRYLSSTYIQAALGSGYEAAVIAISGVDRNVLIEQATSLIQAAMRNNGYAPPATQDPDDVEELVKLGTLGCYRELLASIPEGSIPLPEGWSTNPAKLTYAAILSGDARLSATPTVANAVGGWSMTESDPDVDGSRPQRASRSELAGY